MQKRLHDWIPLLPILLLALALRAYFLLHRGTFWFDEIFSVHFATIPSLSDTVRYWILETNPPLYTLFLRAYLAIAPAMSESLVRLPSLFFGLMSIALLYALGKRLFGKTAAAYSALFLSLSQTFIFISGEARSYSLYALLAIASIYFFYRVAYERHPSRLLWIALFAVDTLLVYTHLTAVLGILAQGLTLMAWYPINMIGPKKANHVDGVPWERKIIARWAVTHAFVLILFFPWLLPATLNKLHGGIGSAWFFLTAAGPNILTLVTDAFAMAFDNQLSAVTAWILIVLGGIAIANRMRTAGEERNRLLFLLIFAGLPIVSAASLNVYISKYLLIAHIALFLLAGRLTALIAVNMQKTILAVLAIVLVLGPPAMTMTLSSFSILPITRAIETREGAHAIVLAPFGELILLNQYLRARSPVVPILVEGQSGLLDEEIVRHNWHNQNVTDRDLAAWMDKAIARSGAKQLFLIQNTDSYDRMHVILFQKGWSLVQTVPVSGNLVKTYVMYEFQAPKNVGPVCMRCGETCRPS